MSANEVRIHLSAQDQQQLLGAILDGADDLIFATDAAMRLVCVSRGLERDCHFGAKDLLGRTLTEAALFGRESGTLVRAIERAKDTGQSQSLTLDWEQDAITRHYAVHILVDGHIHHVRHFLIHAHDISEQRRIEQDLRTREHEFRTLAENWPDNIIRYGLDKRAIYCNQEIKERVTVTAQSVLGCTPTESAPPGMVGAPAYEAQLERTLATGERASVDLVVPHPAGGVRVHSVMIAPERNAEGVICGAVAVGRDVTEQVRMQQALAAKELEFRTLAENSPDNIIRYGMDGRATYFNREMTQRVNVTMDDIIGRTTRENNNPDVFDVDAYEGQLFRTLRTGESATLQFKVLNPAGAVRTHSIAFAPERDANGVVRGAIAVGRDVSDLVAMQQALANKEREFRSLAENAGDNIVRWDTQARMRYLNPAMARLFGHPVEDLLGRTPVELEVGGSMGTGIVQQAILAVAREGCDQMLELRFQIPGKPNGAVHQIRLVPERDDTGQIVSVLGIGRDITEKIAQLDQIESLVRTDPLTRLANRQALQERMPGFLASTGRRGPHSGALLLLDLDQFKSVNDVLGHNAGDALLCEVAHRLHAALRANDLLARLGGDEFVIVMDDLDTPHAVAAVSTKLHAALAAPLVVAQREMRVTASIGVAMFPQDGSNLDELLANADTAMYHAKRSGRSRTEYYRNELGEVVRRRLMLEESMRQACSGEGLELYFQPQVCLHSIGAVLGAEALLRWNHPSLGHLAPDAFIALAEETGMIVPIGRWVLRNAAETAVRWSRQRAQPVHVAINVSTRQFIDDNLPAVVEEVLSATGCEPGWLSIEITESALAQDSARVEHALLALRAMGIRIALDDFGTGYSALNYLSRFPVDTLKLDKSFVSGIGRSSRDDEIVKAFIAMAGALNLATVAEGIETEAQASFLSDHGCSTAQGYLYGRPMPVARFEQHCLTSPTSGIRIASEA